jgi:hypothetical protein
MVMEAGVPAAEAGREEVGAVLAEITALAECSLTSASSLQASKFSLPFRCSHLLEDIRRYKVRVLFAIPLKKDFCVRRSTRSRSCQRRFSFLGFGVSLMSVMSCCLKETLSLIGGVNCIVLDMIK